MAKRLQKLRNYLVRRAAGLPRTAVTPAIDSNLFQAHLSLYLFCGGFAAGKRCLDLGCGTGFGTARLAAAGAVEVVGVDLDSRSLRWAERRYGRGGKVRFLRAPAAAPPLELGRFGLVTAVSLLAHADDPGSSLRAAAGRLDDGGAFIASVPPILDGQTLEQHKAVPSHRTNLYLWDWQELLASHFGELRLFRHLPPAGGVDLADPGPSAVDASEFVFEEIPVADLYDVGSLTAVFVGSAPRTAG